jgi:hypothetical protein
MSPGFRKHLDLLWLRAKYIHCENHHMEHKQEAHSRKDFVNKKINK